MIHFIPDPRITNVGSPGPSPRGKDAEASEGLPGPPDADFASLGAKILRVEIVCGEVCAFGEYRVIVDAAKLWHRGVSPAAVVAIQLVSVQSGV
ncbi:MAG: hypothetical protein WKG01_25395 [Kofleriaceae bacterium]